VQLDLVRNDYLGRKATPLHVQIVLRDKLCHHIFIFKVDAHEVEQVGVHEVLEDLVQLPFLPFLLLYLELILILVIFFEDVLLLKVIEGELLRFQGVLLGKGLLLFPHKFHRVRVIRHLGLVLLVGNALQGAHLDFDEREDFLDLVLGDVLVDVKLHSVVDVSDQNLPIGVEGHQHCGLVALRV